MDDLMHIQASTQSAQTFIHILRVTQRSTHYCP